MEKLEVVNEVWDVRKILALVVVVMILAFGLKTFVLDKKNPDIKNSITQVEGISVKPPDNPSQNSSASVELQRNVQTGFDNLKKEVSNINVVEIATSSPAVQKVINDLKNLQNLPQSQAKQACIKICDGL